MIQKPVKFPDLMASLITKIQPILTVEMAGAKVGISTPKTPNKFVLLRRDGGQLVNQITESVIISATIYANTYETAEDLTRAVEFAFRKIADGSPVTYTDLLTSSQDISDETGQRRFLRFEAQHRGVTH